MRRGESSGGYDTTSPRTLAPGLETELVRYPGDSNDGLIVRDRGPWFPRPRYIPPPVTWVNWTEAGPTRPELGMRDSTWRTMAGSSNSRYPVVLNAPTTGMHTMTPSGVSRTLPRYVETQQMVPARVDRLSPAVYANQTYSQTTRPQGGKRS